MNQSSDTDNATALTTPTKSLSKRDRLKKLVSEAKDIGSLLLSPDLSQTDKDLLITLLDEHLTEKARYDFHTFVRLMAPIVLPEGFKDGRHLKVICDELMELETGRIKKLMVFLPPGSMKSWLCSKLYPAWCYGRRPTFRIITVGHGQKFAEDNFGRPIKDLLLTEEYRKIFPGTTIRHDIKAAGRWSTDQGGEYYAAGALGSIAGRRAHLAILDDIVSEQTAESDQEREKINNWYGGGLRSRLLPEGRELIVMTLWHENDIAGFLLNATKKNKKLPQWKVIRVPAILDEEGSKLLGLPVGSSFWPEFWPLEVLLERKEDPAMTPRKWSALYMQSPSPVEGNIIKMESCRYWNDEEARKYGLTADSPPPTDYLVISVDTAFSEKETAAYSAYSVWAVFHRTSTLPSGREVKIPCLILLDCEKGRWGFHELCKKIEHLNKFHRPDGIVVEKRASGISLIQEMRRWGFPVIEFTPDTDKLSRLHACTPFFENGRIWFPATDYAADMINELTKFPNIPNKDLVDTVSQAILWMRDSWQVQSQDPADEDEEERAKPKTYWQALQRR